jgi:hypothetical protein
MVAKNVSMYHWKEYKDEQLKRRLRKMADIGTSALKDENQLKKVTFPVLNFQKVGLNEYQRWVPAINTLLLS